jgi:hypothetical protein
MKVDYSSALIELYTIEGNEGHSRSTLQRKTLTSFRIQC